MSRGLRNKNPGNIRHDGRLWRGEESPSSDGAFKQFIDTGWGYRAMFLLLDNYRRLHGCDTIRKMIGRYAPPSENATDAYVRSVAAQTGTPPDRILDTRDRTQMIPVVSAMSFVENGIPAVEADVRRGWELFIRHVSG